MHLPAACMTPSCGRASDLQAKPRGPLKAWPYAMPWRWVMATTIAPAEEQEMPPAETAYSLPAALVLPASRSCQGAPVTTVVHREGAAEAVRERAVCAGRDWTVATARTIAVVQASARVVAAFSWMVIVRFIAVSPSGSVGGAGRLLVQPGGPVEERVRAGASAVTGMRGCEREEAAESARAGEGVRAERSCVWRLFCQPADRLHPCRAHRGGFCDHVVVGAGLSVESPCGAVDGPAELAELRREPSAVRGRGRAGDRQRCEEAQQ